MTDRPRVALFVTCLVDLIRPQVGFASVKLLTDAGCDVEIPAQQTCCGQPAWNAGADGHASAIARQVIETFEAYDYVVVPSGSCGGMIKRHYPEVFEKEPAMLARARALAAKTHELVSFLVRVMKVEAVAATCITKACYHDSCSSLREMGVKSEPRTLLGSVKGLVIEELSQPDACCGFGGLFSVKYPEISERIADDKIADALGKNADTLTGGDLGCLLHLAGRMRRTGRAMEVRHVAEILADIADTAGIGEAEE